MRLAADFKAPLEPAIGKERTEFLRTIQSGPEDAISRQ